MTPNSPKSPRYVPHVPPDSAEYLEGSFAQYQSGGEWVVGGQKVTMNTLANPFDDENSADDNAS